MSFLAAIFTTGLDLSGRQRFLLLLPLCLSIAVVYKATRCEKIPELPMAALLLWITIVLGMFGVGAALWVVFTIAV